MIVRGAFAQLLTPGFQKALQSALWTPTVPSGYVAMGKLYVPHSTQFAYNTQFLGFPFLEDTSEFQVMEAERMALIHPDTSKVPIWRQRPERSEHPITAYRAWDVEIVVDYSPAKGEHMIDAYLKSVTMTTRWEGPVMRAHMKPVDPAIWDKDKGQLDETFRLAGIYAFKEKEQAIGLCFPCWGEIALWGRIAQFQLGYRAEVCMIKKLWLDIWSVQNSVNVRLGSISDHSVADAMKRLVDALSRRYQCDVELVEIERRHRYGF